MLFTLEVPTFEPVKIARLDGNELYYSSTI